MMLTKTVQAGHPRIGEEPMFRHITLSQTKYIYGIPKVYMLTLE
jgi:hypothetical protein